MTPVLRSGFPGGSDGKVSAYNAGDPGSIPGSGSSPGDAIFKHYNFCEAKKIKTKTKTHPSE